MKTVSVILTTYNSEKYLQRTLDSIFTQNGINDQFKMELIVVDDCSTDDTITILNTNHISYHQTAKNSGGPNAGRNIGLHQSSGEFICIADHDDVWKPNRLESMLPYLKDVPIVTSGYTLRDSNTGKTTSRFTPSAKPGEIFNYYATNETFLNKLSKSKKGQLAYMGGMIFSGKLKEIRFEEYYGAVDFDWMLRLFHMKPSMEICESLYIRYVDDKNLSLNEKYRLIDFKFSLATIKEYEHLHPNEAKLGLKRIHGSLARYYYIMGEMDKARKLFVQSEKNVKTLLYYLTTFWGSDYVKKHFDVFG